MMIIQRDQYLQQLIAKRDNRRIKIITGIRRCGKSFLLSNLYAPYLIADGVDADHIIQMSLDDDVNAKYRNPLLLSEYLRGIVRENKGRFYVFLDEIQHVAEISNPWLPGSDDKIGFVDVLLGLMKLPNIDLYVTGSNSKMLSSDIVTQFRDRGDEVHVLPLSFREFCSVYDGEKEDAWREYYTYGGLPMIPQLISHGEKSAYLENLYKNTYLRDVVERNDIRNDLDILDDLLNVTASGIGSLTNPNKLSHTFKSVKNRSVCPATVSRYLRYFEEAYLIKSAYRYSVKGKKYIDTPLKYYFSDQGLRNACLGFRQLEENHLMENIIYSELIRRGCSVDVGVVEARQRSREGKSEYAQLEVDFVARKGTGLCYIQSALNIDDPAKRQQEINALLRIPDSFRKIVVVRNHIMPWQDEHGILYIGVRDFLLDDNMTGL